MMSEFQSDIKDRKYDEEGNELDKHGFKIKVYPDGMDSVYKSVANCENMCGLDRKLMEELLKGKWSQSTNADHNGRTSKKIVIEYDIKEKSDD